MSYAGIIFRSMVWSALLTGWETLLPSRADCKAFDKFTVCKGRSLMRGKASGRWIGRWDETLSCPHKCGSIEMVEAGVHSP